MKKNFTLIEVIVTVVIVLILVSFGMTGYQQVLDNSNQKVCETNLKALESAVEIYAQENEIIPATLGQLDIEHLEKGYALAAGKDRLYTRFSYWLVAVHETVSDFARDLVQGRNVFASVSGPFLTFDTFKRFGLKQSIFICPADINGPPSYGINTAIAGKKWSEIGDDVMVVGECDFFKFTSVGELCHRHISDFGKNELAQAVNKHQEIIREKQANSGGYHGFIWNWFKKWKDKGDDDDDG